MKLDPDRRGGDRGPCSECRNPATIEQVLISVHMSGMTGTAVCGALDERGKPVGGCVAMPKYAAKLKE